jgi:hypothetical protein
MVAPSDRVTRYPCTGPPELKVAAFQLTVMFEPDCAAVTLDGPTIVATVAGAVPAPVVETYARALPAFPRRIAIKIRTRGR